MNFINFHSHKIVHFKNVIQISSLTVNEVNPNILPQLCSVGIHPWQSTDEDVSIMLVKLEQISNEPNVFAIGEIGLDRLRGANLQTQIELFKKQVAFAERVQKPIVIHCVRSFSEIQQLRKQLKPTTPWAIHNFMGNTQIAQALVRQGFYLSFCIALAKSPKLCQALKSTPIDKIFLETDDFIENVEEVYQAAAVCLQIDLNELKAQIAKNFEAFFGTTPQ